MGKGRKQGGLWSPTVEVGGDSCQHFSSQSFLCAWWHGDLQGRVASKLQGRSAWLPTLAESSFVCLDCFSPQEIGRVVMDRRQVSSYKSHPVFQLRKGGVEQSLGPLFPMPTFLLQQDPSDPKPQDPLLILSWPHLKQLNLNIFLFDTKVKISDMFRGTKYQMILLLRFKRFWKWRKTNSILSSLLQLLKYKICD